MRACILDVRFAVRGLRGSPTFVLVAVLTVAVGIASTTALAAVVNGVLLQLPFADADRLIRFTTADAASQIAGEVSYAQVEDWRRTNRTLDGVAGIGSTNWSLVMGGENPTAIPYAAVSASFFTVLGSPPLLGRVFTTDDEPAGSAGVVVLSYGLWRSRFNSDPSILGRVVVLSGSSFSVVGVMPPAFRYPLGAELWTPVAPRLAEAGRRIQTDLLSNRGFGVLHVVGRLKRGVSLADAEADLSRLVREERRNGDRMQTKSLVDDHLGRAGSALVVALAAVVLLLVMACANVAGLSLARVARRRQEWAVRRAIGAGALDIVRLALIESAIVALCAGLVGVVVTPGFVTMLLALDPTGLLAGYTIRVDGRVLALAAAASLLTLVISGVGPAVYALRISGTAMSFRLRPSIARRFRRGLVGAQVGLAAVLLVGAGLMVRSVINLARLDLGFDPEKLIVLSGTEVEGASRERHDASVNALLAAIRDLPHVSHAAGVYRAPLQGPIGLDGRVLAEGEPLSSADRHPLVNDEGVTTGYFSTMRIPLVAGRDFTPVEQQDAGVAIISESLAHHLWPGQPAVGRRLLSFFSLRPALSAEGRPNWQTVVGVAADVRYREIERTRFDIYLPVGQADAPVHDIVVRTDDSASVVASLRALVRRVAPGSPATIRTMTSMVAEATSVWRMLLAIMGAFGAFALVLTATGVYGLLAFLVEERTHEIGVRVALGAAPARVGRLIVGEAARLLSTGLAGGLLVAWLFGRVMQSVVFGVAPSDPVALATAAGALLAVGLIAGYMPARRAARMDPAVALRAK